MSQCLGHTYIITHLELLSLVFVLFFRMLIYSTYVIIKKKYKELTMRLLVVEDEQSLREDIKKNCSIQDMK